jgi:uncharacterized protein
MLARSLEASLKEAIQYFPVLTLTGPRQSGKTTLLKAIFPDYKYISLEDLDQRSFASTDPRGFLESYPAPLILDEAQYVPELFSYIQTVVDADRKPGMYILSGSQHFLMMERITQSLAGRAGIFTLLPFDIKELALADRVHNSLEQQVIAGSFPDLYQSGIPSRLFYGSYLQTYLERDLRQLLQVSDLTVFRNFMKFCAGLTGQQLNMSAISVDLGISVPTVKRWISMLESSYSVFLQQPYYRNLNKRIVKAPRLFFYDTGLICHLLNIETEEQLATHPLKGAIIETWFVIELHKMRYHSGRRPDSWYYRDKSGHEIDCILEEEGTTKLIEIKAGKTIQSSFFKNMQYFTELAEAPKTYQTYLLYGGTEVQSRAEGKVFGWRSVGQV